MISARFQTSASLGSNKTFRDLDTSRSNDMISTLFQTTRMSGQTFRLQAQR